MRLRTVFYCLPFLLFLSCNEAKAQNEKELASAKEVSFLDSKIIFSTKGQSETLLGTADVYTRGFSQFDIQSKSGDLSATDANTYLAKAAKQALDWTSTEIDNLTESIKIAEKSIQALGLKLSLPSDIQIVKTTGEEESGAAYTRSSFIVLNPSYVAGGGTPLTKLFLHELFHIYSRANPEKRDAIYATIGFKKMNTLTYPQVLAKRKISNPDAPFLEHYITLNFDSETKDALIILYAKDDYSTGSFFEYLRKELLILEGKSPHKTAKLEKGKPLLYPFSSAKNLYRQIGTNTSYNIHPEEISAEHFTMLVMNKTVQDAHLLDAMKAILVQ